MQKARAEQEKDPATVVTALARFLQRNRTRKRWIYYKKLANVIMKSYVQQLASWKSREAGVSF